MDIDIVNTLWNVTQQVGIHNANNRVEGVTFEAQRAAQQSIENTYLPYAKQLEKLSLVCQAMWTLVQERTGLTDQDLLERVTELDLKDGVLDGKYTKPPVDCPKCDAKISRKFNRCLFCGEEYTDGSAFDTL